MKLIDALNGSFSKFGPKTALRFYKKGHLMKQLTFSDLDSVSNRLANIFLKSGAGKKDRIILCLPKSIDFVAAYLACIKINAICVPLNPDFTKNELDYLIGDAKPKLAVVGPDQNAVIKQIVPALTTIERDLEVPPPESCLGIQRENRLPMSTEAGSDDPALIIYTSGTTGHPKGAVLTQGNLIHDSLNIINIWKISKRDVLCHALPLFHIHGLCFALNTALLSGAETIMLDAFSPKETIERLTAKESHPACTIFMAVPAMYAKLFDYIGRRQFDLSHLRLLTSGSAPLLPKDFTRIKTIFGQEPVEREGMSETGMNFSNPIGGVRKPGSIGLPLPGLSVRVVNPNTLEDVIVGEIGELWLKSPSIIKTYWQKPVETDAAFVNGWFRSGDLGYVDKDGYYFLTDRIKHIIISGGENISPKEVENVINGMELVAESSVVGITDNTWGEKIVAAVVPLPGRSVSTQEIITYCKSYLHPWKCPKQVIFAARLPRNAMGKVLKEKVKALFAERY